MKSIGQILIILLIAVFLWNCSAAKHSGFKPRKIYQSADLIITQLAANSFQHTSYKQTNDFGNVPCNGLIVRANNEVIIFDTPTNDKTSIELIQWIKEKLNCKINAVIPTHFHDDCLGGLNAFDESAIPSYANVKTTELARENNYTVPKNSFNDSLDLKLGNESVTVRFFGEGHTKDNVVGYFKTDNILFGGCLIKELNASKGYLGDANLSEWATTVAKVRTAYPDVKIVVPGHGKSGNKKLLDYTINLFKIQ